MAQATERDLRQLAFSKLASESHAALLNAIDKLRLEGIVGEAILPQMIVCGDQSAGKSSVLQAISGVKFPTGERSCTRFASELRLRRAAVPSLSFSLVSTAPFDRTSEEQEKISSFKPSEGVTTIGNFGLAVKEAEAFLDQIGHRKFFHEKLVAHIQGPDLFNLTLVDLPGIIQSTQDGSSGDVQTVRGIVETYMQDPNSVILAVLAANNDFANQLILNLAAQHDPEGRRTMGIVTKPDLLSEGAGEERDCIDYVMNKIRRFRLGWHVLKNQRVIDGSVTPEHRVKLEREFFARHSRWITVNPDDLGIENLRTKLQRILFDIIRQSLPELRREVRDRINVCTKTHARLGVPLHSPGEQRAALNSISTEVHRLLRSGLPPRLEADLGRPAADIRVEHHRLRAQIFEIVQSFGSFITKHGSVLKSRDFSEDLSLMSVPTERYTHLLNDLQLEKANADTILRLAETQIVTCRENEQLGFPVVDAVTNLFRLLSNNWERLASFFMIECFETARAFFYKCLDMSAPPHIATRIKGRLLYRKFEVLRKELESKIDELLSPYKDGPLVTLDWSTVQLSDEYTEDNPLLDNLEDSGTATETRPGYGTPARDALSRAMAHYTSCLRTFKENVAALAVECILMRTLPGIFSSEDVIRLSDDEARALTDELAEVAKEREQNLGKLETLKAVERSLLDYSDETDVGGVDRDVAQLFTNASRSTAAEVKSSQASVHTTKTDDRSLTAFDKLNASPLPALSPVSSSQSARIHLPDQTKITEDVAHAARTSSQNGHLPVLGIPRSKQAI